MTRADLSITIQNLQFTTEISACVSAHACRKVMPGIPHSCSMQWRWQSRHCVFTRLCLQRIVLVNTSWNVVAVSCVRTLTGIQDACDGCKCWKFPSKSFDSTCLRRCACEGNGRTSEICAGPRHGKSEAGTGHYRNMVMI